MPNTINRRSFQFHGIELYELLTQQASNARNARRARRRVVLVWIANRGLVGLGAAVASALVWGSAVSAHGAAGIAAGALGAVIAAAAALAAARWLRTSAIVAGCRAKESAARETLARRQESLRLATEQLRARTSKDAPG